MSKLLHPLLALIASSTESEMAKYVDYVKTENRILRARLPGATWSSASRSAGC